MSFPPGTEMFQFPGFASLDLCIQSKIPLTNSATIPSKLERIAGSVKVGFPIQRSRYQRLFAPPPSFSQRTTSFIASMRQGIH